MFYGSVRKKRWKKNEIIKCLHIWVKFKGDEGDALSLYTLSIQQLIICIKKKLFHNFLLIKLHSPPPTYNEKILLSHGYNIVHKNIITNEKYETHKKQKIYIFC